MSECIGVCGNLVYIAIAGTPATGTKWGLVPAAEDN